ncbi:helix-turn-helix domain-containing protein [Kaistia defluvii]|uniref:Chromosomal replication initiator DnaA C-terminal domain-containing protein n=1 Tax=Kaistia defluvii TaxID=410841 RepID=A0ABV2R635_9HYPH
MSIQVGDGFEFIQTRDQKIRASRAALAALLRHHGDTPLDDDMRKASRFWKAKLGALFPAEASALAEPPQPEPPALPIDATTHYHAFTVIAPPRVGTMGRIRQIITQVARKHGLTDNDILSARRNTKVVRARQEAMYRAVNETTHSLTVVGKVFGRDHTTVMHGIRQHAARSGLPTPPAFKERQP